MKNKRNINLTYVMGIVFILFGIWVFIETGNITEKLVSNEPGPRLFPYISAVGMIVLSILSMIFDGKKEKEAAEAGAEPYLDRKGWMRLALIMVEAVVFCIAMEWIGFWITAMVGMMVFIQTLKGDKKVNTLFMVIICVAVGTICYFGFTKGFSIPLPKGELWSMLGISMP